MTPPITSDALLCPANVEALFAGHSDTLHWVWAGESGVKAVVALVAGPPGTSAARVVIPVHTTQEGVDAPRFLAAWYAECDDMGIPRTADVQFERRRPDATAAAWRQPPPIARPAPADDFNERQPRLLSRRLFPSDPDASALYPIYETTPQ